MDWLNETFGPVDPERVHAVVVGLEKYTDTAWNLRGPHSDATRFTDWLLARGVPPRQIHRWSSTLPPAAGVVSPNGSTPHPVTVREATDLDLILETFVSTLAGIPVEDGDLLWVFWGGHGAMDGEQRRILYGPAAGPGVGGAVVVEELALLLSSDRVPAFPRQLIMVDACATFLSEDELSSLMTRRIDVGAPRGDLKQFFLFSAGRGQGAGDNPGREGFCGALLDWLEPQEDGGLTPNLLDMSTYIRKHLASVAEAGGPGHEPALFYLSYGPGYEHHELLSGPGAPDPAHLEMLALMLRSPGMPRDLEPLADAVAGQCRVTIPRQRRPMAARALAAIVLGVPRAVPALIEELRLGGSHDAATTITTCEVPSPFLLSPAEHRALLEVLRAVEPLQGWEADAVLKASLRYHALSPQPRCDGDAPYPGAAPARGDGFGEWVVKLCAHLETFGTPDPGLGRLPHLLRFTEYLAVVSASQTKRLHGWGARVTERLGIDVRELTSHRHLVQEWDRGRERKRATPRVVVRLRTERPPGPVVPGSYSSTIWTDRGQGELDLVHTATGCSDAEVVRDINKAVDHVLGGDRANASDAVIECLVPFTEFGTRPDTWDGAPATGSPLPQILGVDHPVVLRYEGAHPSSAEARRRSLDDRWDARHQDAYVVPLPPTSTLATDPRTAAYGALREHPTTARAKVLAAPRHRLDVARVAAEVGCPVVVWDARALEGVPEDHFDPLPLAGNPFELPEQLRVYRAGALTDAAAPDYVLMLEDPSRALPETLVQTALPDATME
ncbi:VMAP-C domain-containing protein [Embleya hyalina]|uniref:vWA-MoxR associated protein C-terminal domain-containing protein n=1 Tax=Embleya hyalina TaxID=516124 RepID=A0A401Z2E8_9ACTN|nr:caspase family protein [Embleya hyalina]GCE01029.1 hypothetical protein EHYA_08768 [Embleya hyalina]